MGRRFWLNAAALSLAAMFFIALSSRCFAQETSEQILKDVAYNEIQDRGRQSCWLYHVSRTIDGHTRSELQVESTDGPLYRLLMIDGQHLTEAQARAETDRLTNLLSHPSEQRKVAQMHEQDEERLQRLTALLPSAFLYNEVSRDAKTIKFLFSPNPHFHSSGYEARAFASLSGMIVIDTAQKRLISLDGTLIHPVDFGFGILGRLEQGGTFSIAREQVSATHWKTSRINVRMSGHIILFKSISKSQDETRSGFHPLPGQTSFRQALKVLEDASGSAAGSLPKATKL